MRRRSLVLGATLSFGLLLALSVSSSVSFVVAGGGCHRDGPGEAVPSAGSASVVKMDGCTYAPTITRVPVGATVRFLNTSPSPHDVTGRSGAWRSDLLDTGHEYSQQFREPGLYPYSCSLHPGMAGVVIVGATDAELIPAAAVFEAGAESAAGADTDSGASVDTAAAPATTDDGGPYALAGAGVAGLLVGALATAVVGRRRNADA